MPTCQKKDQLCRCIDWPDEDFDVEIDHFIRNFEFLHVELEYASLDAREPVRVCSHLLDSAAFGILVRRCSACFQGAGQHKKASENRIKHKKTPIDA